MRTLRGLVGFIVLSLGCGGGAAEEPASSTSRASVAAGDETAGESGAEASGAATEPSASPATETSRFGTTPEEAARVCEEIGLEDVRSCAFREGGRVLPGGGRADIVVIAVDDPSVGEERSAHLVIRTPDEPEYPTTAELGTASEQPGMMMDYELGPIAVDGAEVSVQVTLVSEEYPNTGDPDADPETIREEQVVLVTCSAENGVYDCERRER